jgi:hypothetical protein
MMILWAYYMTKRGVRQSIPGDACLTPLVSVSGSNEASHAPIRIEPVRFRSAEWCSPFSLLSGFKAWATGQRSAARPGQPADRHAKRAVGRSGEVCCEVAR